MSYYPDNFYTSRWPSGRRPPRFRTRPPNVRYTYRYHPDFYNEQSIRTMSAEFGLSRGQFNSYRNRAFNADDRYLYYNEIANRGAAIEFYDDTPIYDDGSYHARYAQFRELSIGRNRNPLENFYGDNFMATPINSNSLLKDGTTLNQTQVQRLNANSTVKFLPNADFGQNQLPAYKAEHVDGEVEPCQRCLMEHDVKQFAIDLQMSNLASENRTTTPCLDEKILPDAEQISLEAESIQLDQVKPIFNLEHSQTSNAENPRLNQMNYTQMGLNTLDMNEGFWMQLKDPSILSIAGPSNQSKHVNYIRSNLEPRSSNPTLVQKPQEDKSAKHLEQHVALRNFEIQTVTKQESHSQDLTFLGASKWLDSQLISKEIEDRNKFFQEHVKFTVVNDMRKPKQRLKPSDKSKSSTRHGHSTRPVEKRHESHSNAKTRTAKEPCRHSSKEKVKSSKNNSNPGVLAGGKSVKEEPKQLADGSSKGKQLSHDKYRLVKSGSKNINVEKRKSKSEHSRYSRSRRSRSKKPKREGRSAEHRTRTDKLKKCTKKHSTNVKTKAKVTNKNAEFESISSRSIPLADDVSESISYQTYSGNEELESTESTNVLDSVADDGATAKMDAKVKVAEWLEKYSFGAADEAVDGDIFSVPDVDQKYMLMETCENDYIEWSDINDAEGSEREYGGPARSAKSSLRAKVIDVSSASSDDSCVALTIRNMNVIDIWSDSNSESTLPYPTNRQMDLTSESESDSDVNNYEDGNTIGGFFGTDLRVINKRSFPIYVQTFENEPGVFQIISSFSPKNLKINSPRALGGRLLHTETMFLPNVMKNLPIVKITTDFNILTYLTSFLVASGNFGLAPFKTYPPVTEALEYPDLHNQSDNTISATTFTQYGGDYYENNLVENEAASFEFTEPPVLVAEFVEVESDFPSLHVFGYREGTRDEQTDGVVVDNDDALPPVLLSHSDSAAEMDFVNDKKLEFDVSDSVQLLIERIEDSIQRGLLECERETENIRSTANEVLNSILARVSETVDRRLILAVNKYGDIESLAEQTASSRVATLDAIARKLNNKRLEITEKGVDIHRSFVPAVVSLVENDSDILKTPEKMAGKDVIGDNAKPTTLELDSQQKPDASNGNKKKGNWKMNRKTVARDKVEKLYNLRKNKDIVYDNEPKIINPIGFNPPRLGNIKYGKRKYKRRKKRPETNQLSSESASVEGIVSDKNSGGERLADVGTDNDVESLPKKKRKYTRQRGKAKQTGEIGIADQKRKRGTRVDKNLVKETGHELVERGKPFEADSSVDTRDRAPIRKRGRPPKKSKIDYGIVKRRTSPRNNKSAIPEGIDRRRSSDTADRDLDLEWGATHDSSDLSLYGTSLGLKNRNRYENKQTDSAMRNEKATSKRKTYTRKKQPAGKGTTSHFQVSDVATSNSKANTKTKQNACNLNVVLTRQDSDQSTPWIVSGTLKNKDRKSKLLSSTSKKKKATAIKSELDEDVFKDAVYKELTKRFLGLESLSTESDRYSRSTGTERYLMNKMETDKAANVTDDAFLPQKTVAQNVASTRTPLEELDGTLDQELSLNQSALPLEESGNCSKPTLPRNIKRENIIGNVTKTEREGIVQKSDVAVSDENPSVGTVQIDSANTKAFSQDCNNEYKRELRGNIKCETEYDLKRSKIEHEQEQTDNEKLPIRVKTDCQRNTRYSDSNNTWSSYQKEDFKNTPYIFIPKIELPDSFSKLSPTNFNPIVLLDRIPEAELRKYYSAHANDGRKTDTFDEASDSKATKEVPMEKPGNVLAEPDKIIGSSGQQNEKEKTASLHPKKIDRNMKNSIPADASKALISDKDNSGYRENCSTGSGKLSSDVADAVDEENKCNLELCPNLSNRDLEHAIEYQNRDEGQSGRKLSSQVRSEGIKQGKRAVLPPAASNVVSNRASSIHSEEPPTSPVSKQSNNDSLETVKSKHNNRGKQRKRHIAIETNNDLASERSTILEDNKHPKILLNLQKSKRKDSETASSSPVHGLSSPAEPQTDFSVTNNSNSNVDLVSTENSTWRIVSKREASSDLPKEHLRTKEATKSTTKQNALESNPSVSTTITAIVNATRLLTTSSPLLPETSIENKQPDKSKIAKSISATSVKSKAANVIPSNLENLNTQGTLAVLTSFESKAVSPNLKNLNYVVSTATTVSSPSLVASVSDRVSKTELPKSNGSNLKKPSTRSNEPANETTTFANSSKMSNDRNMESTSTVGIVSSKPSVTKRINEKRLAVKATVTVDNSKNISKQPNLTAVYVLPRSTVEISKNKPKQPNLTAVTALPMNTVDNSKNKSHQPNLTEVSALPISTVDNSKNKSHQPNLTEVSALPISTVDNSKNKSHQPNLTEVSALPISKVDNSKNKSHQPNLTAVTSLPISAVDISKELNLKAVPALPNSNVEISNVQNLTAIAGLPITSNDNSKVPNLRAGTALPKGEIDTLGKANLTAVTALPKCEIDTLGKVNLTAVTALPKGEIDTTGEANLTAVTALPKGEIDTIGKTNLTVVTPLPKREIDNLGKTNLTAFTALPESSNNKNLETKIRALPESNVENLIDTNLTVMTASPKKGVEHSNKANLTELTDVPKSNANNLHDTNLTTMTALPKKGVENSNKANLTELTDIPKRNANNLNKLYSTTKVSIPQTVNEKSNNTNVTEITRENSHKPNLTADSALPKNNNVETINKSNSAVTTTNSIRNDGKTEISDIPKRSLGYSIKPNLTAKAGLPITIVDNSSKSKFQNANNIPSTINTAHITSHLLIATAYDSNVKTRITNEDNVKTMITNADNVKTRITNEDNVKTRITNEDNVKTKITNEDNVKTKITNEDNVKNIRTNEDNVSNNISLPTTTLNITKNLVLMDIPVKCADSKNQNLKEPINVGKPATTKTSLTSVLDLTERNLAEIVISTNLYGKGLDSIKPNLLNPGNETENKISPEADFDKRLVTDSTNSKLRNALKIVQTATKTVGHTNLPTKTGTDLTNANVAQSCHSRSTVLNTPLMTLANSDFYECNTTNTKTLEKTEDSKFPSSVENIRDSNTSNRISTNIFPITSEGKHDSNTMSTVSKLTSITTNKGDPTTSVSNIQNPNFSKDLHITSAVTHDFKTSTVNTSTSTTTGIVVPKTSFTKDVSDVQKPKTFKDPLNPSTRAQDFKTSIVNKQNVINKPVVAGSTSNAVGFEQSSKTSTSVTITVNSNISSVKFVSGSQNNADNFAVNAVPKNDFANTVSTEIRQVNTTPISRTPAASTVFSAATQTGITNTSTIDLNDTRAFVEPESSKNNLTVTTHSRNQSSNANGGKRLSLTNDPKSITSFESEAKCNSVISPITSMPVSVISTTTLSSNTVLAPQLASKRGRKPGSKNKSPESRNVGKSKVREPKNVSGAGKANSSGNINFKLLDMPNTIFGHHSDDFEPSVGLNSKFPQHSPTNLTNSSLPYTSTSCETPISPYSPASPGQSNVLSPASPVLQPNLGKPGFQQNTPTPIPYNHHRSIFPPGLGLHNFPNPVLQYSTARYVSPVFRPGLQSPGSLTPIASRGGTPQIPSANTQPTHSIESSRTTPPRLSPQQLSNEQRRYVISSQLPYPQNRHLGNGGNFTPYPPLNAPVFMPPPHVATARETSGRERRVVNRSEVYGYENLKSPSPYPTVIRYEPTGSPVPANIGGDIIHRQGNSNGYDQSSPSSMQNQIRRDIIVLRETENRVVRDCPTTNSVPTHYAIAGNDVAPAVIPTTIKGNDVLPKSNVLEEALIQSGIFMNNDSPQQPDSPTFTESNQFESNTHYNRFLIERRVDPRLAPMYNNDVFRAETDPRLTTNNTTLTASHTYGGERGDARFQINNSLVNQECRVSGVDLVNLYDLNRLQLGGLPSNFLYPVDHLQDTRLRNMEHQPTSVVVRNYNGRSSVVAQTMEEYETVVLENTREQTLSALSKDPRLRNLPGKVEDLINYREKAVPVNPADMFTEWKDPVLIDGISRPFYRGQITDENTS